MPLAVLKILAPQTDSEQNPGELVPAVDERYCQSAPLSTSLQIRDSADKIECSDLQKLSALFSSVRNL